MVKAYYVWTHLICVFTAWIFFYPQQLSFQHSLYLDIIKLGSGKEETEELCLITAVEIKQKLLYSIQLDFLCAGASREHFTNEEEPNFCKQGEKTLSQGFGNFFPQDMDSDKTAETLLHCAALPWLRVALCCSADPEDHCSREQITELLSLLEHRAHSSVYCWGTIHSFPLSCSRIDFPMNCRKIHIFLGRRKETCENSLGD